MKKIISILMCLLLCSCSKPDIEVDYSKINEFNSDNISMLPFEIHSKEYLLADVSQFKILYADKADEKIWPASLTKLMTLDVVLNLVNDLNDTSSISDEQIYSLILDDASLAGIQADYEYKILDLLYGLILPSGADCALALENYFNSNGMDLVKLMNNQADNLGLNNSNFVNTTGLHDDNHYSTLNDLFLVVMDILKYEQGRNILETKIYTMPDDLHIYSTLIKIEDKDCIVLGGKTGYTSEAGQNVIVLYKANNRSYMLFLANAMGDVSLKQTWHLDDAMEIMKQLY